MDPRGPILFIWGLITHQNTAYIQNRRINKTGRLVCRILEIEDTFDFESYLAFIDVENFFDSFVSSFFMAVLKKVGFSSSCLEWSEVVLKNHQYNVGSTGIASLYFKVGKGKH